MRDKLRELLYRYRHGWILSYLVIYQMWFIYVERTVTRRFHIVHMAVDDYIPFVEIFIVPYLLWFGYVAVAITWFFFKDVQDFYKLCAFLFVGMTVFLVVSTVYPNGHYLRPRVFERDNIFISMVKGLYMIDTPTNLFPSIHVYNSIGTHLAVMHSEKLREKKWVRRSSFVLMATIIASTMFLKQHSVFDVLTGCAMALVMYTLVYAREWQFGRRQTFEGQYREKRRYREI
ncbi:MAG: phosphatase PAP2 family protein [Lachnospiraceae bacterium]|nr:phosphatase PAP2 family protein [Lachnospiraceae bacterium]